MSASLLLYCIGVGDPSRIASNSQGDCLGSTNALHRVWSQWMDGCRLVVSIKVESIDIGWEYICGLVGQLNVGRIVVGW